jgi:protein SCO1/2
MTRSVTTPPPHQPGVARDIGRSAAGWFVAPALLAWLAAGATPAAAQYNGVPASGSLTRSGTASGISPAQLKNVKFDQKLGATIPGDLVFRDETGQAVHLGRYFTDKPVILTLVYYECPMLCTEVLNGLVRTLKVVGLEPGKDFSLVTVSFNPRETPQLAAEKKRSYIQRYQQPAAASAWHFLTGEEASIDALTSAVGFQYYWDQAIDQYAHATGIMVVTPDRKLAKYFFGIEFSPRDLRLALVQASGGRIGTPVDQVLLYCYHYDASQGRYGLAVLRLIRLGGVVTLVVLGSFLAVNLRRERRARRRAAGSTPASGNGQQP